MNSGDDKYVLAPQVRGPKDAGILWWHDCQGRVLLHEDGLRVFFSLHQGLGWRQDGARFLHHGFDVPEGLS